MTTSIIRSSNRKNLNDETVEEAADHMGHHYISFNNWFNPAEMKKCVYTHLLPKTSNSVFNNLCCPTSKHFLRRDLELIGVLKAGAFYGHKCLMVIPFHNILSSSVQ